MNFRSLYKQSEFAHSFKSVFKDLLVHFGFILGDIGEVICVCVSSYLEACIHSSYRPKVISGSGSSLR